MCKQHVEINACNSNTGMCNWDYEENMCIDWTAPVLSAGQYNWKQIYPATSIRSLNCQQEDHDIGGDCEVIYY